MKNGEVLKEKSEMQIVVRTYPDNYEALGKALEAGYEVKFATQIGNMIEYICEKNESPVERLFDD